MTLPNRHAFLLVFAVPALLPVAFVLGRMTGLPDLCAFFPILFLDALLPLLDSLMGRDTRNPDTSAARDDDLPTYYEALVMVCLPLHLALLVWAGHVLFVQHPFGIAGAIGWTLSLGYIGGITAINAAHELIHRPSRLKRAFGGTLLSVVSYSGFKIEHVRGHHVHVSTPEDASSAPRGMSLYRFLPQAIVRNTINAWRLEASRLRRLGLPAFHFRNELIGWHALTLALVVLHGWAYGVLGVAFFLGQSLFAILSLETINYVEHYGLRRRRLASGRYERPDITHSWNSSHRLSNLLLFNLARHSDHHANPTRPYPLLRHDDASPQLPAGYGAMFLLAQVPPLWRRVMDPRVDAYEVRRAAGEFDRAT